MKLILFPFPFSVLFNSFNPRDSIIQSVKVTIKVNSGISVDWMSVDKSSFEVVISSLSHHLLNPASQPSFSCFLCSFHEIFYILVDKRTWLVSGVIHVLLPLSPGLYCSMKHCPSPFPWKDFWFETLPSPTPHKYMCTFEICN